MSLYPYNAGWPATIGSEAGPVDRGFIANYEIVPDTIDTDGILDGQAVSNSVTTTATEFLAQPDVARTITVLPVGTTNSVPAGDVVITGTDIAGNVITDALPFAENATAATESVKAFASITSILFPIQDGTGITYDVGWGKKLGLPHKRGAISAIVKLFDGAADTGTETVNATDLAKNLFNLNGTPDGEKVVRLSYIV
jgi:hypothetical protein